MGATTFQSAAYQISHRGDNLPKRCGDDAVHRIEQLSGAATRGHQPLPVVCAERRLVWPSAGEGAMEHLS